MEGRSLNASVHSVRLLTPAQHGPTLPLHHPRRIRKILLLNLRLIPNRIITLSTSIPPDMRTMHLGPKSNHNLMHIPTQQRIHTQLETLSHADLLGQERITRIVGVELLVRASAVLGVRCTHRLGDRVFGLVLGFRGIGVDAGDEVFEEVSEPTKCDVVLGDLLDVVPAIGKVRLG
jgi:hypothetical protein